MAFFQLCPEAGARIRVFTRGTAELLLADIAEWNFNGIRLNAKSDGTGGLPTSVGELSDILRTDGLVR
jgi:hypothetical protein